MDKPIGKLNVANVPKPFADPALPVTPANVVTIPEDDIKRIKLFDASATIKFPFVSITSP